MGVGVRGRPWRVSGVRRALEDLPPAGARRPQQHVGEAEAEGDADGEGGEELAGHGQAWG